MYSNAQKVFGPVRFFAIYFVQNIFSKQHSFVIFASILMKKLQRSQNYSEIHNDCVLAYNFHLKQLLFLKCRLCKQFIINEFTI